MSIGMLWFDNSNSPLSAKIEGAISYYEKKYGRTPTLVVVHPATIIDDKCNITVETSNTIMLNHLWVGVDD